MVGMDSLLRNWDKKEKIKFSPCLVGHSESREHFLGWGKLQCLGAKERQYNTE